MQQYFIELLSSYSLSNDTLHSSLIHIPLDEIVITFPVGSGICLQISFWQSKDNLTSFLGLILYVILFLTNTHYNRHNKQTTNMIFMLYVASRYCLPTISVVMKPNRIPLVKINHLSIQNIKQVCRFELPKFPVRAGTHLHKFYF